MKKNVIYFVLLIGIAASFTSCLSFLVSLKVHKMVVDESVPLEQTVTITFFNNEKKAGSWFKVQEWYNESNSKKLGKEFYGGESDWSLSNQKIELTVPAGNNSFIFDATYTFSNSTGTRGWEYKITDVELRYYLEQGKKYCINGISRRLPSDEWELFVSISDVTEKKAVVLKEWKIGETE